MWAHTVGQWGRLDRLRLLATETMPSSLRVHCPNRRVAPCLHQMQNVRNGQLTTAMRPRTIPLGLLWRVLRMQHGRIQTLAAM